MIVRIVHGNRTMKDIKDSNNKPTKLEIYWDLGLALIYSLWLIEGLDTGEPLLRYIGYIGLVALYAWEVWKWKYLPIWGIVLLELMLVHWLGTMKNYPF